MTERKALYAGSFDPYTRGHHAIVRKAACLFDQVDVLIGINTAKKRRFDAEAMEEAIDSALRMDGILNVRVVRFEGLVADYCAKNGIEWYVRGLRNALDYAYEENNAQVNQLINPGLETIYLRASEPAISSTMVRELLDFGQDVSKYVPPSVGLLILEHSHQGR